jgi:hypothetical protein
MVHAVALIPGIISKKPAYMEIAAGIVQSDPVGKHRPGYFTKAQKRHASGVFNLSRQ